MSPLSLLLLLNLLHFACNRSIVHEKQYDMWTRNAIEGLGFGCVVTATQVTFKQMRGVVLSTWKCPMFFGQSRSLLS